MPTPQRRTSPRRRHNPYFHQMGDHTLFHNGSTARMFPALSRLKPAELGEMFGVPPADKEAERYEEVMFSEPYAPVPLRFRPVDAPVRDEQQNRIIARGGIVSTSFTNEYNLGGANGNGSGNNSPQRRPGTGGGGGLSSASTPQTPDGHGGHNPNDPLKAYPLLHAGRPAGSGGNAVYHSETIRLHGSARFKVTTPADAKVAIVNTVPSLNIGFDVDETLRRARNEAAAEDRFKQCLIASRIPTAPPIHRTRPASSSTRRGVGSGGIGSSSSYSSPSEAAAAATSSHSGRTPADGRIGSGNSSNRGRPPSSSTLSSTKKQKAKSIEELKQEYPNLAHRPFSRGTVGMAQQRLTTDWYLNNGPSPIADAIRGMKEQSKIERENRRVERQRTRSE